MRNRVSMRFTRFKHQSFEGQDAPPQNIKISHPILKHSSISFEESHKLSAAEQQHPTSSAARHDRGHYSSATTTGSSQQSYTTTTTSTVVEDDESPGQKIDLLPMPEVNNDFANILQFVDSDYVGDDVPELTESPAVSNGNERTSAAEPPEMFSEDTKEWSPNTLSPGKTVQQQFIPATPRRESSRRFSFEPSVVERKVERKHSVRRPSNEVQPLPDGILEARRSSKQFTENVYLKQHATEQQGYHKRTSSGLNHSSQRQSPQRQEPQQQSREQAAIKQPSKRKEQIKQPPSKQPPHGAQLSPVPPDLGRNSSTIEEYKLAIARLNEIRLLQIQQRDARIAQLESLLLRHQQTSLYHASPSFPEGTALQPVGASLLAETPETSFSEASSSDSANSTSTLQDTRRHTNAKIPNVRLLFPIGAASPS